ncbi:SMR family transporter [Candidatus Pelagibacter bacterium]|jgi:small multidrug resistance pump|nr:SMR family transporter [Candidatus Pelagibacter bacterium]MDB9792592.1 SMR family transporter [Candidatus Pelagibacter sp.]MDC0419539.1 SMR family transporter [Candidatus Pelagibacter sp.]MDC0442096.1 SMR family transporter [Candidatus Pelagibacter sp.]|tara:strand:+ start:349 stop:687 length:339 start_codon:yes stop_codon:yes gene_type:complete
MNFSSGYVYLLLAIILGISSNGFLKTTNGFTNIVPTIFCITTIVLCLFFLSKAMNLIPVGFTYATYGGLTITAVTIFGIIKYNQLPNIYGTIGIVFIIIGVILVNYLGKLNN